MRKNLYKFAALTMFAALSITACKKHEAVDISGIHTSAAETMAETTSNETKADPAANNSKSDSSKTDASKAGSSGVETQKDSNASDALSVKSKIATEKTGKVSIEYPILSNLRDASMTQAVNELLKKEATSIITAWELDTEKDEVSINCDLVSLDKNKAVFTFHGMVNVAETAHPSNVRYAVSVNLNTGSPIGLTAYADADSIAEYLSSDDVVVVEPADTAAAVKDSIKSSGKDLWQTVFAECDFTSVKDGTFPQAFSYEKDGDIYLIVPVSHAAGDYALVKYSPETK